ncbi:MAG: hypothetical protein ABSH28_08340, partial [Acidobacteriota bacterium]
MKLLPIQALVGLCVLFAPTTVVCQPQRVILGATSSLVDNKANGIVNAYLLDNPDIPPQILNLMRDSETRYVDGSNLIKVGESAKARIAFDEAVDLLFQCEWDLASTPVLSRYFQDLIQRIQRDESRYLRSDESPGEKPERAVVDELEKIDLIPI